MNLQYFPQFIRINYPKVANESNEDLIEIGTAFKKYLEEKFAGDMEKLELIWDIDANAVIMNQVRKNPFMVNGYHPALVFHFGEFVTKMKNEINAETNGTNK